jgi:hypothetical protein
MADDASANVLSVSIERDGTTAVVRLRGKLLAGMGGQLCAKVNGALVRFGQVARVQPGADSPWKTRQGASGDDSSAGGVYRHRGA